jgi:hypothetical protein
MLFCAVEDERGPATPPVELLSQLQAAGSFKIPSHRELRKQDRDLDPLRARPDFQKLLGAIAAEAPEGEGTAADAG